MFFRKKNIDLEMESRKSAGLAYERSDCGRVFGWWLCMDKERVADINYRWFDTGSQFWCEYRVFPFNSRFHLIGYDCNLWCSEFISMESRFINGYHAYGFIMFHMKENLIRLRNLCIPEDVFNQGPT